MTIYENMHKQPRFRRGFALVLSLVLMAFLLLLMVSLSTLLMVETRVAALAVEQQKARGNALLSVNIAIGELQETMGPDQRVNALAALDLDVNSDSPRRYWTGVFESWADTDALRPSEPVFLRWLVSGESEAVLEDRETGLTGPLSSSGTIALVKAVDGTVEVEAGLVSLENQGAYAWWVGDENAKARVHPAGDAAEKLEDWHVRRQAGAAKPYFEMLPSVGSGGSAEVDPQDPRWENLLSPADMRLLGVGETPTKELFHTVSPYSQGLFTNVRAGGLRKDLSFYLEKAPANRPVDSLYALEDIEGIHFGELWSYYHMWRYLLTGGGSHPDGGTLPADVPVVRSNNNAAQELIDPFALYKRPISIGGAWVYSVFTTLVPGEEGEEPSYELEIMVDWIHTLWNPYDVSLDVRPAVGIEDRSSNPPYLLDVRRGADEVTYNIWGTPDDGQRISIYSHIGTKGSVDAGHEPLTMRPGEVVVYSQSGEDGDRIEEKRVEGDTVNTVIYARRGWSRQGGVVLNREYVSTPFDLEPGDTIQVRLRPGPASGRSSGGASTIRSLSGYSILLPSPWLGTWHNFIGGMKVDNQFTHEYSWTDSLRKTGFPYSTRGDERWAPDQNPHVYKPVPESGGYLTLELPVGAMLGPDKARPIAYFAHRLRTEEESNMPGRFLQLINPAANAYVIMDLAEHELIGQGSEVVMKTIYGMNDVDEIFGVLPKGGGFFGGGFTAATGNTHVITHSLPRSPVFSIAAFQHAAAIGKGGPTTDPMHGALARGDSHTRMLEPSVGKIIGNSHALPIFPPDKISGVTNSNMPAVDHSYMANEALWDDWFFSSIAPGAFEFPQYGPDPNRRQRKVFEDFASGIKPLPNSNVRFQSDKEVTVVANELFNLENVRDDAHLKSAQYLSQVGAFNVNSTNEDAWALLLASLRGTPVPYFDPVSGGVNWESSDVDFSPVPGLLTPAGGRVDSGDLNDTSKPEQWLGFRGLDDDQIRNLAAAIVEEVRKRGPFLSLADFVNRRLGEGSEEALELAKNGALQAALDRTVNPTRAEMGSARWVDLSDVPSGVPFPEALVGPRATGMAGLIGQADVLTLLGPSLSARSDTFTIRGYGEVHGFNNAVTAKAWCEAVVQRMPEYVDSDDDAYLPAAAISEVNQRFGRKFKVVSFRWLSEDEI